QREGKALGIIFSKLFSPVHQIRFLQAAGCAGSTGILLLSGNIFFDSTVNKFSKGKNGFEAIVRPGIPIPNANGFYGGRHRPDAYGVTHKFADLPHQRGQRLLLILLNIQLYVSAIDIHPADQVNLRPRATAPPAFWDCVRPYETFYILRNSY